MAKRKLVFMFFQNTEGGMNTWSRPRSKGLDLAYPWMRDEDPDCLTARQCEDLKAEDWALTAQPGDCFDHSEFTVVLVREARDV